MLTFPLFIREAHMLLDPSRNPLRVAMHNLMTPAKTLARHPALQKARHAKTGIIILELEIRPQDVAFPIPY